MKILSYFIVILLAPTIILLNFRLLVFNKTFYQREFLQVGVYQNLEKNLADEETVKLIDYLCCTDTINKDFFTQREIDHMKDVKSLITLANNQLYLNILLILTIIAVLALRKKYRLLQAGLKLGSIFGAVAIFILAVSSYLNFDAIFKGFHLISFKNDLWLLPQDSNLLKLFPQEFFRDFANRIAIQSTLMFATIFSISQLVKLNDSKNS